MIKYSHIKYDYILKYYSNVMKILILCILLSKEMFSSLLDHIGLVQVWSGPGLVWFWSWSCLLSWSWSWSWSVLVWSRFWLWLWSWSWSGPGLVLVLVSAPGFCSWFLLLVSAPGFLWFFSQNPLSPIP